MGEPEILEKQFLKNKQFPEDKILWYLADRFIDKIIDKKIIICQSPTGTGKSVILPYKLLIKKNDNKFLFDRIFVSEPRRIATEGPANAVMSYNHDDLYTGQKRSIGYWHGKDKENPDADLLYITEGSLVNRIKEENFLEQDKSYCFILDEAHEKNKETEEILINFKYLMDEGNWNSKNIIIILSATMPVEWIPELNKYETNIISVEINSGEFNKSFTETILTENNPIKNFFGIDPIFINFNLSTTFPITEYYSLKQIENYLGTALELAKRAYKNNEKVLIFISSNSQIKQMKEYIEKDPEWSSIKKTRKVYYVSSIQEDWKNLKRKNELLNTQQGIIISTSILETSVTVNNLTTVIDTGKIRQPIYISDLSLKTLPIIDITELNRIQRKGRVGRKKPGKIYYLYTEEYKNNLRKETFSALTVNDISQEVLKYKKNNELFKLFEKSNICKKMESSIKNSIKKLQSYNLLDEKENITNFGLNVLNKLEKTILGLEYICLLYYSIHNNEDQFPNLLFIVTFLNYINDQNNTDIFEEIVRSSENNIFHLIFENKNYIWSKIKTIFISNYNKFPEIKAKHIEATDFKYDKKFISRALYSVFNKNIAEYIEEYDKTKGKIQKYKLPNGLEIMEKFFYNYIYSPQKIISFQGEGTLMSKNVLYMNSFFADNISMKYCIDVTNVIEEDKRLYLSFQMQINDRIKELEKLIKNEKYKEQTTDEEKEKKEKHNKIFVEHKEKLNEFIKELNEFKDIDLIIIGGYAVKQYYNDHQTSDIDIKVYPKNNYDVNDFMTEIIKKYTISKNYDDWKTKGRFIFDKEVREKYNNFGEYNNQDYNYIKTDNKLTISKFDGEYGFIPLIDIVFEKTKDKGSYTIIDGLKYRNKYYLINEILENTKAKDETFEKRLDKAIEDHKQFLKLIDDKKILENQLEALKSEQQGGSLNPNVQAWTPNDKLIEEQIKLIEEQIKDLKNSKENLYPDKVKSWIRQLENLRDKEVYTQLIPKANIDPNESKVVQPSEGKVNLKVSLI